MRRERSEPSAASKAPRKHARTHAGRRASLDEKGARARARVADTGVPAHACID